MNGWPKEINQARDCQKINSLNLWSNPSDTLKTSTHLNPTKEILKPTSWSFLQNENKRMKRRFMFSIDCRWWLRYVREQRTITSPWFLRASLKSSVKIASRCKGLRFPQINQMGWMNIAQRLLNNLLFTRVWSGFAWVKTRQRNWVKRWRKAYIRQEVKQKDTEAPNIETGWKKQRSEMFYVIFRQKWSREKWNSLVKWKHNLRFLF